MRSEEEIRHWLENAKEVTEKMGVEDPKLEGAMLILKWVLNDKEEK